jgi:hypothetical protein
LFIFILEKKNHKRTKRECYEIKNNSRKLKVLGVDDCGTDKQSITLEWHQHEHNTNKLKFIFEKRNAESYSLNGLELTFNVTDNFYTAG